MTKHRIRLCLTFGLGLLALACQPNLGVPEGNRTPTADARVLGMEGLNATVDYMGMPVKVTLDASFSKDLDGTIKQYRWLSGKRKPGTGAAGSGGAAAGSGGAAAGSSGAAAGSGGAAAGSNGGAAGMPHGSVEDLYIEQRWVPDGAPPDWPDDVMQPVVELTEGEYVFVLWVVDDHNVISAPSTLKVTVRMPLDPAVQSCVDAVYDNVPSACKTCLCSIDDTCRMMSSEMVCDAGCWGLLNCIGSKCPTFMSGGDTSCLTSMCTAQLGGATGATAIAPCISKCLTQCRGM
jgi:hypothetical protein